MASESLASEPPHPAAHNARSAKPARNGEYATLGVSLTFLVLLYDAVGVCYLAWRLGTFNPQAMTFSVIVYAAEVFGFVAALMHIFMVWRLSVRTPRPAPDGLSVDVFIPSY